jgi:NSS family neurotransmitter:Na+ symporter
MLSLLEVPVVYLVEEHNLSRRRATLAAIITIALVGTTATWSSSLLSHITLAGKNFFDLYDFLTSNILLPLGGIFIAIFVGWRWGYQRMRLEFSNDGQLGNEGVAKIYFFLVKYVAPIAIAIVLLTGLGIVNIQ